MNNDKMEIVIEKPSHLEIQANGDSYVLWDKLGDQRFDINKTFCDIFSLVDGKKTLRDISVIIAGRYGANPDMVKDDIRQMYSFLRKNKLILCKGTITYMLIKLYNKAIFIN